MGPTVRKLNSGRIGYVKEGWSFNQSKAGIFCHWTGSVALKNKYCAATQSALYKEMLSKIAESIFSCVYKGYCHLVQSRKQNGLA